MKFRKISFTNNRILGSVCFDFTDASGKTVDTIILAGENGCGKSYLLSFLNSYSPVTTVKELGFKLMVEVEFDDIDIRLLNSNKSFANTVGRNLSGNIVTFIHDSFSSDDNVRAEYPTARGKETNYAIYFAHNQIVYKSVFSDVEINFSPGEVRHTTSKNIDEAISSSIRSANNLATEIKQLLVDINELDNDELAEWVDKHAGMAPTEEVLHRRIKRFTNAFNSIFPNKRFVGIENRDNHKNILFEEFGKRMEIDQLSSGEKQIVFRGGFLLRNLGSISGSPVLVDEPELSLHPQWQLRILGFLKNLFTDPAGKQTSQLIVATHSPFILHNSTRANDKVIVMKKNDKGDVVVLDKPEYYSWSDSTAVEEAFNVEPLSTNKKVIVFLEGETDEIYYNKTIEVFGLDSSKISFTWIGHYVGGEKGKAENTGDKALNNAYNFFLANPGMMHGKKVYLLYDCDTNKPETREGDLFVGRMTKNSAATNYQIGVENLLSLPAEFDYNKYYKNSNKVDEYGAKSSIASLDKTALANNITSLPNDQLESILKNVKLEIEKMMKKTGI